MLLLLGIILFILLVAALIIYLNAPKKICIISDKDNGSGFDGLREHHVDHERQLLKNKMHVRKLQSQHLRRGQMFFTELLGKIKDDYVDPNYKYNIKNLPSTTSRHKFTHEYEDFILNYLEAWSDIFENCELELDDMKIMQSTETDDEFICDAMVTFKYYYDEIFVGKKQAHLRLYGSNQIRDCFEDGDDMKEVQLLSITLAKT